MVNAGRILILAKGTWDNLTSYEQLDLVTLNGVAYIARQASVGINPATDTTYIYWMPFGTASEIATTTTPGVVMPDGTSITIDDTGLITANLGIENINDVTISTLLNGQVLTYNGTTQKWVNTSLGTAAAKNSTNAVTSASTDLVESGAVYTEMQKAYKSTDSAETSIADSDYIPFYDVSASAPKKILKSNLAANVDSTLSASSTNPVKNSTITKVFGTPETIGGNASKAYSTGDLMLGSTGQMYVVTADISSGGTITAGGNVNTTDGLISQISNISSWEETEITSISGLTIVLQKNTLLGLKRIEFNSNSLGSTSTLTIPSGTIPSEYLPNNVSILFYGVNNNGHPRAATIAINGSGYIFTVTDGDSYAGFKGSFVYI